MNIALDWDDTYTKDPEAWDNVIAVLLNFNHDVRFVTHRHPIHDCIGWHIIPVHYTNGVAKKWWLEANTDWTPDVYIDDKPEGILSNSDKSKEWLAEWRATREG